MLIQILGHLALASSLLVRAQSVDLASKASVTSFYMVIWKVSDYISVFVFGKYCILLFWLIGSNDNCKVNSSFQSHRLIAIIFTSMPFLSLWIQDQLLNFFSYIRSEFLCKFDFKSKQVLFFKSILINDVASAVVLCRVLPHSFCTLRKKLRVTC